MTGILEAVFAFTTIASTLNTTLKNTTGIGMTDVVSNALGNLVSDGVKKMVTGNKSVDTQRINHDLQHAFRDALYLALYDIGGKGCFPMAWKKDRDVPDHVILWKTGKVAPNAADPLGAPASPQQMCRCLWELGKAVKDEQLFPFEPPLDETHLPSSVYFYLQARTAQKKPLWWYNNITLCMLHNQCIVLMDHEETDG